MAKRKFGDKGLTRLVNSEKRSHRIAGGNVIIKRTGVAGKIIGRDGGLYQIEVTSPGRFYERDVWLESMEFKKV
tara:strand:+ start:1533 stop:1754 length:222 start_codon:yes stop_codon:yes gene_type:complete